MLNFTGFVAWWM